MVVNLIDHFSGLLIERFLPIVVKDFAAGEFQKDRVKKNTKFQKMLTSKTDFKKPYQRSIVDVCSSIDALYEVSLIKEKNGLPLEFIAKKVSELEKILKNPSKSPDVLFIRYKYQFPSDRP